MERPGATTSRATPDADRARTEGRRCGSRFHPRRWRPEARHPERYRQPRAHHQRGSVARYPVCDAQTKHFNEEAAKMPGVDILTVSMDLPFAQKRWCGAFGVDKVKMLSDHKDGSFGSNYGTLIKELRIESSAIFVVDPQEQDSSRRVRQGSSRFPELRNRFGSGRSAPRPKLPRCGSAQP